MANVSGVSSSVVQVTNRAQAPKAPESVASPASGDRVSLSRPAAPAKPAAPPAPHSTLLRKLIGYPLAAGGAAVAVGGLAYGLSLTNSLAGAPFSLKILGIVAATVGSAIGGLTLANFGLGVAHPEAKTKK